MTSPSRLRRWQRDALAALDAHRGTDFLVCASPGAGKTTMALAAAAAAFRAGTADHLFVVCPSDHLRNQWADAAASAGLPIDPGFSNSTPGLSSEFCGIAVTYAQVASAPAVHRSAARAGRAFVILDEIHHAGDDRHWGDAIRGAYGAAARRLALTGTPWRSDTNPIPFVTYEPDADGARRSVADFTYSYADALADGVVRPVLFLAYTGHAQWADSAGTVLQAHLDDPLGRDVLRGAWRTALDPAGAWISEVLTAADRRLDAIRADVPDAGGLVLASSQRHARAYARLIEEATGTRPVVVTSDTPGSSALIDRFRNSDDRWLVAVRQVSEGVDVPRLAVCVYATNIATPLFFTQAIGRVIRARSKGESASVFLPSVAPLLELAADVEKERGHVLRADDDGLDDDLREKSERRASEPSGPRGQFQALGATGQIDRVIYSGTDLGHGPDLDGAVVLTLPGLLDGQDLAAVLARRAAERPPSRAAVDVPLHRKVADARRELHGLVGAVHHRTGAAHGEVYAQLRARCGGPAAASATLDQIRSRIDAAREWLR